MQTGGLGGQPGRLPFPSPPAAPGGDLGAVTETPAFAPSEKKKRHDGARIPAGIPVRIREIRDKHQALLIPSKSAVKDGWTQLEVFGLQQSGIGCQLQDVTRGVTNSQPLMRDLPDRPASGSEMLQGLEESRLKYKCDNCVTCGDNGAAVASHELARVVCQFPRGRRAPSD